MFNHLFKIRYSSLPMATYSGDFCFTDAARTSEILTSLHYHGEFEVLLITDGEIRYTINNEHYAARAGDLILVNPYDFHYGDADTQQAHVSYLCIDIDLLQLPALSGIPVFDDITGGRMRFVNHIPCRPETAPLTAAVRALYTLLNGDLPYRELAATGALLQLFYGLLTLPDSLAGAPTRKSLQRTDFARAVLTFIRHNHGRKITSDDAARHMSFEKSYFCRLFKRTFGSSFSNYLNFFRVTRARMLLAEQAYTVTGLAAAVGFDDLPYFSAVFKKHFGKPPSAYLRESPTRS